MAGEGGGGEPRNLEIDTEKTSVLILLKKYKLLHLVKELAVFGSGCSLSTVRVC